MLELLKGKLMAATAGLALVGALAGGGTVAFAQTHQPSQQTQATQQVHEQDGAEANEVEGVENEEPNEPSLPGGGHADQPGADVQHEFEGIE